MHEIQCHPMTLEEWLSEYVQMCGVGRARNDLRQKQTSCSFNKNIKIFHVPPLPCLCACSSPAGLLRSPKELFSFSTGLLLQVRPAAGSIGLFLFTWTHYQRCKYVAPCAAKHPLCMSESSWWKVYSALTGSTSYNRHESKNSLEKYCNCGLTATYRGACFNQEVTTHVTSTQ